MLTGGRETTAHELARVCRPGGHIGLANWTPTGFVGRMLKIVSTHVPPPAGAMPPTRWGTEETMRELFGAGVKELSFSTATVAQRLPSPEFFADFFLEYYGPTLKAAERLPDPLPPPTEPEERAGEPGLLAPDARHGVSVPYLDTLNAYRSRRLGLVEDGYKLILTQRAGTWYAELYRRGFRPLYKPIPEPNALRLAYKVSVTAVKR